MKISFAWSTRREGNSGYVLEKSSSGEKQEFGPMPVHLVLPFVDARRRLIAMRADDTEGLKYVPEFNYLSDPKDPTNQH